MLRTRDDRDQPIRVRDPGTLRLQSRAEREHPHAWELRAVFVNLRRKESVLNAVAEILALWIVAGLFLVPGIIKLIDERSRTSLLLLLIGVVFGVFGAMRPRMRIKEQKQWCDEFRRCLNRDPYCVACDYHLKGISPQSDGCTVCPECGGAWRIQDPES